MHKIDLSTPFHFALRVGSNFSHVQPLNWLVSFSLFLYKWGVLVKNRFKWNICLVDSKNESSEILNLDA